MGALAKYGKTEIFNTDQASQYTLSEFTETFMRRCIKISMDVKGRVLDNVFIEHPWRTFKSKRPAGCLIYKLKTFDSMSG